MLPAAPVAPPRPAPFVPVIPDSAPFTTAQRSWLNGFFAGMFGHQVAAGAVSSPAATLQADAPAPAAPEVEEEFPWHDSAIPMDERMKLAEEKPLARKLMAAMAQLDCGACGYVCQTYSEAIANGEEKDLTRCTPGGRDTSKMLKTLVASAPKNMVPVSAVGVKKQGAAAPASDAPLTWDRNNPYPARLMHSKMLNAPISTKDTRHVVIDLRSSGLTYKPGDALGLFPENCPDLVGEILDTLGLTGAEDVPGWDGLPMSLRDALVKEFTVTRPTPDLLDILFRCATDENEKAALAALRDSEDGAGDLQIIDLLHKFPSARPAAGDFVATLSPLAPRLYSISSSLKAHPNQVHLTVGAVRYENAVGRKCGGVASTFLADRLRSGQTVRVFVHASAKFGPPPGDQPAIMVGPGTGIAPFRSFLQERAATGCKGKNWLLFGDQRESYDFLYRAELEQYQQDGLLTRLDTAFSRDTDDKVYVQHRMLQNGAELFRWLEEGGHFYVCGDAKRMAADVDKALRQVIAEHGKMSAADADAYVANLVRAGRYQRDVY
jgi:sulfite reductase (NADPH) flavoprotein alpha-component